MIYVNSPLQFAWPILAHELKQNSQTHMSSQTPKYVFGQALNPKMSDGSHTTQELGGSVSITRTSKVHIHKTTAMVNCTPANGIMCTTDSMIECKKLYTEVNPIYALQGIEVARHDILATTTANEGIIMTNTPLDAEAGTMEQGINDDRSQVYEPKLTGKLGAARCDDKRTKPVEDTKVIDNGFGQHQVGDAAENERR